MYSPCTRVPRVRWGDGVPCLALAQTVGPAGGRSSQLAQVINAPSLPSPSLTLLIPPSPSLPLFASHFLPDPRSILVLSPLLLMISITFPLQPSSMSPLLLMYYLSFFFYISSQIKDFQVPQQVYFNILVLHVK